jgi:AcrR family transcriptional regulator
VRSTVAAELRRARPRRGTPEETRSRLVAAAAHEFNVRGYHGTDSNRIATRAGYAAGTFYKHFADKREAFLAAYEAWVTTEWAAVGRELDSARLGRDVAAERIVELVLAHHARWHGLRSALAALLAQDADVRRFHREQRRRQLDLLAVMRRRTGSAARSAEEDALLLFTLERACDAMASGEARDLGIDETALRRLLRDAVARAITDSAPRRPRVRR